LFKDLLFEDLIFFVFENFFKDWVVTSYKLSNYSAFNGIPHKPPVRNLLNLYLEEMDRFA